MPSERIKIVFLGDCDPIRAAFLKNFVRDKPEDSVSLREDLNCNTVRWTPDLCGVIKRISIYDLSTASYSSSLTQSCIDHEKEILRRTREVLGKKERRGTEESKEFGRKLRRELREWPRPPNYVSPSTFLADLYFLFFLYSDRTSFEILPDYINVLRNLCAEAPLLTPFLTPPFDKPINPRFVLIGITHPHKGNVMSHYTTQSYARQNNFSLHNFQSTDFELFSYFVGSLLC